VPARFATVLVMAHVSGRKAYRRPSAVDGGVASQADPAGVLRSGPLAPRSTGTALVTGDGPETPPAAHAPHCHELYDGATLAAGAATPTPSQDSTQPEALSVLAEHGRHVPVISSEYLPLGHL
jgi:hypothetical protein